MTTFECPKCHERAEALATSAGHRCKSAKNKFVAFTVVKKEAANA